MATKPDNEARMLMEAMVEFLRDDLKFMEPHVSRLRDRFDAKLRGEATPRGGVLRREGDPPHTDHSLSVK